MLQRKSNKMCRILPVVLCLSIAITAGGCSKGNGTESEQDKQNGSHETANTSLIKEEVADANVEAAVSAVDRKKQWIEVSEEACEGDLYYVAVANGEENGIKITRRAGTKKELTIPKEIQGYPVVMIEAGAFRDTDLTSVVIPESVLEIGDAAFAGCTNLVYVMIPKSVRWIGVDAFQDTLWLTFQKSLSGLVTVNNIVIDGSALSGAVEIPDSVIGIAPGAFTDSQITSLTIPDTVGFIGADAFAGTPWWEERTLGRAWVVINGILLYAEPEAMIVDGQLTIPDDVLGIEGQMFAGCSEIASVVLPESILWIGDGVFAGCGNLQTVKVSGQLKRIGTDAFAGCTALREIALPESLTNIGRRAFQNCRALRKVSLPAGVRCISDETFWNCSSLQTAAAPGAVSIGSYAFGGCVSLTKLELADEIRYVGSGAFSGCHALSSLRLPGEAAYIARNAYEHCEHLTELILPDNTADFWGTTLTADWYNGSDDVPGENRNAALKVFSIPEGVTVIAENAFAHTSLTEIVIPDGVEEIGAGAFAGTLIREVIIPESVTVLDPSAFAEGTKVIRE